MDYFLMFVLITSSLLYHALSLETKISFKAIKYAQVPIEKNKSSIPILKLNVCGPGPTAVLCKSAKQQNIPGPINWDPIPHKYLLAFCVFGQLSNQIMCLRKYMFLAIALQRTLIIGDKSYRPCRGERYSYNTAFDKYHVSKCLGKNRVISVSDFLKLEKVSRVKVDFHCWWKRACGCQKRFKKNLVEGLVSISGKNNTRNCKKVNLPAATTMERFMATFGGLNSTVISLGDVFYTSVKGEGAIYYPNDSVFRLKRRCRAVQRPVRALRSAARSFVRRFLGPRYLSVHLRRGDFYKYCLKKNIPLCYPAIAQVASCVAGVIEGLKEDLKLSMIFISTNGKPDEIVFLQETVMKLTQNSNLRFVTVPSVDRRHNFTALHEITDIASKITLEKLLLSLGSVFYANRASTLSLDTFKIRTDQGKVSRYDGYCSGYHVEFPFFKTLK